MSDIVTRLRRWTHAVDAAPACDLMDEAADEIERLRLTDAEREALSSVLARLCCETGHCTVAKRCSESARDQRLVRCIAWFSQEK